MPSSGYGDITHMIMPSFVLAAGTIAAVIRLQQTTIISVLEKPFIQTLRAKGFPMRYILLHHVLPNSFMPVITMIGTYFGTILGGSVIIEDLFSIPGMGSYVLAAIWGEITRYTGLCDCKWYDIPCFQLFSRFELLCIKS